jgi:hypothetical protein
LQLSRNQEQQLQLRTEELQQQVSILKMTSGDLSDKDRKDFERKINQYIREIDKTISYLSQ